MCTHRVESCDSHVTVICMVRWPRSKGSKWPYKEVPSGLTRRSQCIQVALSKWPYKEVLNLSKWPFKEVGTWPYKESGSTMTFSLTH